MSVKVLEVREGTGGTLGDLYLSTLILIFFSLIHLTVDLYA